MGVSKPRTHFQAVARQPVKGDPRPWNWAEAGLSLSGVFAYAATDEFHQIFVPTRTPAVTDVMIDTCGGAVVPGAAGFFRGGFRAGPA